MDANQVLTVLGPRDADQLGFIDAHTHVWINDVGLKDQTAPVIDQPDVVERELQAFREAGGGTLLDCQPGECGRDGNQLREISRKTGVQIISCTGFHLQEYYPQEALIWELDRDQARELFLGEIRLGVAETRRSAQPVYPGFIKIAVRENPASSPQGLVEAALQASLESGLMIAMHTQQGQGVEAFCDWFQTRNYPLDNLVVCHIDKRPDPGLHKELAEAGCLLEYDTFFRPKYHPAQNLWPLLRRMIEDGYEDSIACATDLADISLWSQNGGPGLPGLITDVQTRLENEFNDTGAIQKLLGGNIGQRLSRSDPGEK